MKPTIGLKLQKHANAEGRRAVALRIRFKTVKVEKEYKTGIFATPDEYKDITNPNGKRKIADTVRELRSDLNKVISKAESIAENRPALTPELFETLFNGVSSDLNTLSGLFDDEIAELDAREKRTGKPNGRVVVENAKRNLIAFFGDVPLQAITVKRLEDYERVHREKGNSYNYIGSNLRMLRKIFNNAVHKLKKLSVDYYPFGKGGYGIPSEIKENNNFLSVEDKDKLLGFVSNAAKLRKVMDATEDRKQRRKLANEIHREERMEWAVAMWSFMFYSFGINPTDACALKFKDIDYTKGEFVIHRIKTDQRKKVKKTLNITIHPEAQRIMNVYGTRSLNPESYIFPVLEHGLEAREIKKRVHAFYCVINKYLKLVCNRLGIKQTRCYTARHSFAYVVLKEGLSKTFLQQAMGHAKMETTEHYTHRITGEQDSKERLTHALGIKRAG